MKRTKRVARERERQGAGSDRRDHLVDTALRLFNRNGFHATGIDTILAESGVAKMTLYKHFRTKEELIIAALRHREAEWLGWFDRTVRRLGRTPRDRLLAVFDALGRWIRGEDAGGAAFCGCPFINVAGEYADPKHPVHAVATGLKRQVVAYVTALAREAGASDPETLGRQLCLLAEGAVVHAHVAGDAKAAKRAKGAAEVLIAAALRRPRA
ncbi:MAG TPA: TetR/AcrR family transcriptional regulator [Tepidisphaeraceae bacterium]|nr:TetR/AcrR family transcriptional regulator [Tepidisphaeraceae bacterium]